MDFVSVSPTMDSGGMPVIFDGKTMNIAGESTRFSLKPGESSIVLHAFLDKSVLEVYANNRLVVTRVIEANPDALRIVAVTKRPKHSEATRCMDNSSDEYFP